MNAIHLLRYRSKIQTQRSLLQMSAFHYSVIALVIYQWYKDDQNKYYPIKFNLVGHHLDIVLKYYL